MLLEKFLTIARLGAVGPQVLWLEEYKKIRDEILSELKDLTGELDEGTRVKSNASKLVSLLEQDDPNDLELAKSLLYVADLFNDAGEEEKTMAAEFIEATKKFQSIAQDYEFAALSRDKLKNKFTPEEQQRYDLRLFRNEGEMYCLEFYLALYKKIIDAKTEMEKRKYIENHEVALEFGRVPGIWIDFKRDEVLTKFIYLILDDNLREELTKAYFYAKIKIIKLQMNCDKTGKCAADYSKVSFDEIVGALRKFLISFLQVFQKMGIENLSSHFYTPYGQKPLIEEVLKQLV